MKNLSHYIYAPHSGKKPKQIIVLLHGYGSNGQDLISLAPYWQQAVPDTIFASPDAPFTCEIAPEMGYQWFSLQDRTPEKDLAGVIKAADFLNSYLDALLKEYEVPETKLALVGFSQGSLMSLYAGPHRDSQIAGILGYSGDLIGGDTLDNAHKPPVFLVHGEADSVVPVEKYHRSVKILNEKGFLVCGHTTKGLQHSIDNIGIEKGAEFLSEIMS